jgi:hypothetical protein
MNAQEVPKAIIPDGIRHPDAPKFSRFQLWQEKARLETANTTFYGFFCNTDL